VLRFLGDEGTVSPSYRRRKKSKRCRPLTSALMRTAALSELRSDARTARVLECANRPGPDRHGGERVRTRTEGAREPLLEIPAEHSPVSCTKPFVSAKALPPLRWTVKLRPQPVSAINVAQPDLSQKSCNGVGG
jgi:hypothetical protein